MDKKIFIGQKEVRLLDLQRLEATLWKYFQNRVLFPEDTFSEGKIGEFAVSGDKLAWFNGEKWRMVTGSDIS